jgi:hypothetical protein
VGSACWGIAPFGGRHEAAALEPLRDLANLPFIFKWRCRTPRSDARWSRLGRVGTAAQSALGTGYHFIELCIDQTERVWVMLQSGARGVGNRIGSYFSDARAA